MKTSYDSTSPYSSCLFLSSLCSRTSRESSLWSLLLVPSHSFTSVTCQRAVRNLASIPTSMEAVLFKVSRIRVDSPAVPSVFMFSVAVTMASLELLSLLNLDEFLLPDHRVLPVTADSFASSPEAVGRWFLCQGLLTFSSVLTPARELIPGSWL